MDINDPYVISILFCVCKNIYWKNKIYILILTSRFDYAKSYPEIIVDWIANAPKWQKFELENFRPTVANKSELVVCLYFFPIDKHVLYIFHLGCKNMEKLSPNRSLNNKFSESYSSAATKMYIQRPNIQYNHKHYE